MQGTENSGGPGNLGVLGESGTEVPGARNPTYLCDPLSEGRAGFEAGVSVYVCPAPSLGCWPAVPGAGDRCLASVCPLPEQGQLAQHPHLPTSVRFPAVPWGNFDLERMRVTDLAASQGRAMSPSPGLGCPAAFPPTGTPGSYSGVQETQKGSFLLSFPALFSPPPFTIQSLVHALIHSALLPLHSLIQ